MHRLRRGGQHRLVEARIWPDLVFGDPLRCRAEGDCYLPLIALRLDLLVVDEQQELAVAALE